MERDRLHAEKQERLRTWDLQSDPKQDNFINQGDYSKPGSKDSYGQPIRLETRHPNYTVGHVTAAGDYGSSHNPLQQSPDLHKVPGYDYHGNHTPPEKLQDNKAEFRIEVQTDPNRKVIVERQSTDTETRFYSYSKVDLPNDRQDYAENKPKKVPPPVSRKPNVRRQPPVGPQPSTGPPQKAESILRQEILQSNRRPGADMYHGGSMDTGMNRPHDSPRAVPRGTSHSLEDMPVRRIPPSQEPQQRGYSPDHKNVPKGTSPVQMRARVS